MKSYFELVSGIRSIREDNQYDAHSLVHFALESKRYLKDFKDSPKIRELALRMGGLVKEAKAKGISAKKRSELVAEIRSRILPALHMEENKVLDNKMSKIQKRINTELEPITICEILSDPDPKRMRELMTGNLWYTILRESGFLKGTNFIRDDFDPPAWFEKLSSYAVALGDWYEQQGGTKAEIIPKIKQMASCEGRAKWAAWSGKAWRGFGRSLERVSNYRYTGEAVKLSGVQKSAFASSGYWLVATVGYKSRYAVQSWTANINTAYEFSNQTHGMTDHIQVILEMEIASKDGFLSPDVSNKLAPNYTEHEVLRCTNETEDVKAYVSMDSIMDEVNDRIQSLYYTGKYLNLPKEKKKAAVAAAASQKLLRIFKDKAFVDKLMAPSHPFYKELMKKDIFR